ncbi:MAG: hypothetical protein AAF699_18195 [Pseudomonadota bacterium]
MIRGYCVTCSLVLSTVLFGFYSSSGFSQMVTNGYICSAKNPGGEDTRRFYREQDGVAINLSPDSSFPIVCPIIIDGEESSFAVVIRLGNTGTSIQRFSCALEEYDLEFNLIKTTGKTVDIAAGDTGDLSWAPINLVRNNNFLSMRCILPPKGTVGTYVWF